MLQLAQELLKREELTYEDVAALIGRPPHGDKQTVEMADTALLFPTTPDAEEAPDITPPSPRDGSDDRN